MASNHPVDFATGQTTFSATRIKNYYQHMIDAGTLDIYWTTQFIDFGFIVAVFCIGALASGLIARLGSANSWGSRLAKLSGILVMSGAISDAIENLFSFILLSQPTNFMNWLAIPYSSFAVLKFFCLASGMLVAILALVIIGVSKLWGFIKPHLIHRA